MTQPIGDIAGMLGRPRQEVIEVSLGSTSAGWLEEFWASATEDLPPLPAGASWGAMTPMMVLAILRRRMNDLDGQISGIVNEIDLSTRAAEALTRKLEALEAVRREGLSHEGNGDMQLNGTRGYRLEDPESPGVKINVEAFLGRHGMSAADMGVDMDGVLVLKEEQINSYISQVKQELSRINSGNEIRMVHLQTAMQQRTQQVSLASNMIKSLDEAQSAIIRNIGA